MTGFEPFGRHVANPSGSVARLLHRKVTSRGNEIVGSVLPVSYRRSVANLWDLISLYSPDAIVMLGLAPQTDGVAVERYARNLVGSGTDVDGVTLGPGHIDSAGHDGFAATMDTHAIVLGLQEQSIPATLSEDAGDYVCNHLFYRVSAGLRESGIAVGFLHVPESVRAGRFAHALLTIL